MTALATRPDAPALVELGALDAVAAVIPGAVAVPGTVLPVVILPAPDGTRLLLVRSDDRWEYVAHGPATLGPDRDADPMTVLAWLTYGTDYLAHRQGARIRGAA